jgi:hypothetical protein
MAPLSAGAALGKPGGKARAAGMRPERRAQITKKAAAKRWGNKFDLTFTGILCFRLQMARR